MNNLQRKTELMARAKYGRRAAELSANELHCAMAKAILSACASDWQKSRREHLKTRRACYFSAEYLIGRAIYNNIMCLKIEGEASEVLKKLSRGVDEFESIEDEMLGNGGLGRLAACFLDSAATHSLPLDGYGIRYRFGLFKQKIENGFQIEEVYDSFKFADSWTVRREADSCLVHFADGDVNAVPYDMIICGYGTRDFSTLRLWQCEPINQFDFALFNEQDYAAALKEKNNAENISRVLYPNDSTDDGKLLRLKQQYFFTCASLKDIIKKHRAYHGDLASLPDFVTVQLNDTHPVIGICELIRLLCEDGFTFDDALAAAGKIFNYTNHTVMAEALEKWDIRLIEKILPEIAEIIRKINAALTTELQRKGIAPDAQKSLAIIQRGTVHMANLACFVCKYINGVAQIHTDILKQDVLKNWYALYPEKFQNKTNGITQRRFLRLCNPRLSDLITALLNGDGWIRDLSQLARLEEFADDRDVLDKFAQIKRENKKDLSRFLLERQGEELEPDFIVDAQIKRLHEYKRQLLNALAILELYFEIKDGALTDFYPTAFIFGAKAAPGYTRAKGIIKLINEIKKLIEADRDASKYIKIIFVQDYNVTCAEKIVAAADTSEQISTAGTEASGTGNMKFMLNGAVTLGTLDGANVEIVRSAGRENNYIFGAGVEQIEQIKASYDPQEIYKKSAAVRRALDCLVDGTLSDGGSGIFKEIHNSLLNPVGTQQADAYFLLLDFEDYLQAKIRLNRDYRDKYAFARKCFMNTCRAGNFSSDRTVREYAQDIWKIKPIKDKL